MIFPLYDDDPRKRTKPAYVTWGIIGLCILIWLAEVFLPEPAALRLIQQFGVSPTQLFGSTAVAAGIPAAVGLVTYMFLHASWSHVIGNMIFLWVFGDDIEDALGPLRFLAFYIAAGVGSALIHIAFHLKSGTGMIGASGAISGVLAAYLLLRPCANVSAFVVRDIVRIKAIWVILVWLLWQLYQMALHIDDNVAYTAHFGGFAAGAIAFLLIRPHHVKLFQCVSNDEPSPAES